MRSRMIKGKERNGLSRRNMRQPGFGALPGYVLMFLVVGVSCAPAAPGWCVCSDLEPVSCKSLVRRYDEVSVRGEYLAPLDGVPIASLRLYAFREGRFRVIPFQVDERNSEGEFVFPSGSQASEDEDLGHLDYNDELVFMVTDSGDRAPRGGSDIAGVARWVEIELSDPLAAEQRAWVYCCHFPDTPPAVSAVDYVRYDPDREQIISENYLLGYRKGMSLYNDLHYPDGKGGFGPDIMDRIKVRIRVKFLFNILKVSKTEEDFHAEVVGWKDGPVRVLRNVQNYVRVLFNLSSPSVFSVTEYYARHMYTPLSLTVPFNPKWMFSNFGISDWTWHFYGDLPGLEGGTMYTNLNRDGIPISTEYSKKWYEEHVDTRYLGWGYATREHVGTWFCNLLIPDALYQFTECFLNFDRSGSYPPEDVRGEIAGGATMDLKNIDRGLWNFVRPGTYVLGLETFFAPPGLKPEGVQEWRNIREYPVQVLAARCYPPCPDGSVGNVGSGPLLGAGASDPQGVLILATDLQGRNILLRNPRLHFGHMKATGLTVAIGQEVHTRQWYDVALGDIREVEHRVLPREPVTGMERPLVARITRNDGTVLDLVSCKCCTLSGNRPDGKRVGYLLTELKGWRTLAATTEP